MQMEESLDSFKINQQSKVPLEIPIVCVFSFFPKFV